MCSKPATTPPIYSFGLQPITVPPHYDFPLITQKMGELAIS
jgi:hypothetical protein